mmetsp:Transcript_11470/g.33046  ORF Transcript_11470/g.33046 Transcript_11470/m.33046 type:complete len:220 (-) Transcript_11470:246-905(-)
MDGPLLHPPASKAPRPPLLSPLHPSHGSWPAPGRSQSTPSARETPDTVPRPHRHADSPPVPCTDPISPLVALRRRASAVRVPACPGFTPCGPVPQRRGGTPGAMPASLTPLPRPPERTKQKQPFRSGLGASSWLGGVSRPATMPPSLSTLGMDLGGAPEGETGVSCTSPGGQKSSSCSHALSLQTLITLARSRVWRHGCHHRIQHVRNAPPLWQRLKPP